MMWKCFIPLAIVGCLGVYSGGHVSGDEVLNSPVSSDKALNDLFSKQWVKVDAEGGIEGQLFELTSADKRPLSGLPVNLVRDGRVVVTATSDESGKFRFEGVATGPYSLVTRTNQSFAALALQVLDATSGSHLSSSIEVRPVRSAAARVKAIVRSQSVPAFVASVSQEQLVSSNDPIASERRFALNHVVRLDANGNLLGQLAKPGVAAASSDVSGTTVFVLKGEDEVARAEVDDQGRFSIAGLVPGVYGFVAAGASGIGATSFQVVDPGLAVKTTEGARLIAFNLQDCCPTLNCEIVPTCEVTCCEPQIVETIIEEPVIACEQPIVEETCGDPCGMTPACGGGCGCGWGGGGGGGYGGGGGGGGIFGGGGFGQILGLAGLAGIAAVIADDDNDDGTNLNQPPIRVSPVFQ